MKGEARLWGPLPALALILALGIRLGIGPDPASAQEGPGRLGPEEAGSTEARPRTEAATLLGEISLDGRLDEEAWSLAPAATTFTQGPPVEGIPAEEEAEVRVLVGNAVLRWEYLPGSTIFLVCQRRQAGRVQVGDFDFDRDLEALLDAPSDDRFMLKVNYWLGL